MAKGAKSGGGSRKGIPNKSTADVRAAISLLAQRNIMLLEGWLKRVARDDPGRAAEILLKTIEYHIPKLQRTEVQHGGEVKLTGQDLSDEQLLQIATGRDQRVEH